MPNGYSALSRTIQQGLRDIGQAKSTAAREALLRSKMEFDIAGEETRRRREAETYGLAKPERMRKQAEIDWLESPFRMEQFGRLETDDADKLEIQGKAMNLGQKIFGITRTETGDYVKPDGTPFTNYDFMAGGGQQYLEGVASMMSEPETDDLESWTNLLNQRRTANRMFKQFLPEEKDLFDPWVEDAQKRVAELQKVRKPTYMKVWDITNKKWAQVTPREFAAGKEIGRFQAEIPFKEKQRRAGILAEEKRAPEKTREQVRDFVNKYGEQALEDTIENRRLSGWQVGSKAIWENIKKTGTFMLEYLPEETKPDPLGIR